MKTTGRRGHKSNRARFLCAPILTAVLMAGGIGSAFAQNAPAAKAAGLTTLITETPEEGFALAVKLSQKAIGATQKDVNVRKELRPKYSQDPASLIAVSHVVATNFQTIAAANGYWRK